MMRTTGKAGLWMVAGMSLAALAGCQNGSAGKPFGTKAVLWNGKERRNPAQQFVSVKRMNPVTEKPAGQWNSYDIECRGGSIRCYVNGVLQNQGAKAGPTSGWICLQSEGGPIEFRNIYVETK